MSAGVTKITTMNDFPSHSGLYSRVYIVNTSHPSLLVLCMQGIAPAHSQLDVAWTAIPCTSTVLNEKGWSNKGKLSVSLKFLCADQKCHPHMRSERSRWVLPLSLGKIIIIMSAIRHMALCQSQSLSKHGQQLANYFLLFFFPGGSVVAASRLHLWWLSACLVDRLLRRLSTVLRHVSLRSLHLAPSYLAKNTVLVQHSWSILAMCPAYIMACWLHMWDSGGICVLVASSSLVMLLGHCLRRAICWARRPNMSSLSCSAASRAHNVYNIAFFLFLWPYVIMLLLMYTHNSAPNITVEYTHDMSDSCQQWGVDWSSAFHVHWLWAINLGTWTSGLCRCFLGAASWTVLVLSHYNCYVGGAITGHSLFL